MSVLLEREIGKKALLMGNEALVRGAYEAGLDYASCYPGTPSSEVSNLLYELQGAGGFRMDFATNEKVAMEAVAGASMGGLNCLTAMKHVGLNVASDPLGTLTYLGVRGSLVVYSADDPSMFSSQNEQDNRQYARLFGLPCFEPATAQEMKDMTVAAFALSAQMGMPVMVRATTRVAHSRGVVELGDIRPKAGPRRYEKDYAFVPLPGNAVRHHKRLVERMRSLVPVSDASPFNRVEGPADARLGVVASSAAVNYVLDAVKECGLSDTVGVFRLGMTWPLPENALLEFLRGKDTVLVLEELEPLVEEALRAMAQKNGLTLTILGKGTADLSTLYEYTPARVSAAVAEAFGVADVTPAPLDLTDAPQLVNRPPSLCAGCPHRMSYYGVKLGCEGRDVIFATDIGCYSLGFMAPLRMADIGVCMGAAASMPAGLELAVGPEQRIVGFIGDSTLFHSGLTGIANAVYNHHRFVLVVLDNMVTAMTGHQPSPGRDASPPQVPGTPPLTSIDMEAVIRALGVEHIQTVRPTNLKKVAEVTRAALDHDGVSVIICREPCPLHMRRLSKAKKPVFGIDGERCVNCHTCVDTFGCPAFQLRDGKVSIDPVQCIGCAVCAQVCPNNAIRPQK